jgi:hypothetical protein
VFSALRDATSANDINLGGNQQTWRFNLNGKLGTDSGLMLKGSPTGAGGSYTPILRIEAGSNAIGTEALALLTGRYGGNAWMRFNCDAELEVGTASIKPVLSGARIVATNLIPAGTASGATAANSIPAFPAAPGSFLRYRGTAYTWEQPIWNELVAPIDNRDFAMGAYRTTFAFTGINGNAFVVSETNSTANGRLTNISSNSATVIPLTVSTTSSLRGFDVAPTSGDMRARYGARFSGPLRLTTTPTTNEFGAPMIKLPILGTDEDGNIIEGQRQAFPVTILNLANTQVTVADFDDSHMFVRTVSSPATVTLPVTMPRNGLVIIVLNLGTQHLTVARGNAAHFINNAQHDYVIGPAAGTPVNRPNGIFIVSDGGAGFFTMPFDGNATWINGANVAFGADFLASNSQGQLVRATATLPQTRITGFPINASVLATNAQGEIVDGVHEPSAPNFPIIGNPITANTDITANDFAMSRMFIRASGNLTLPAHAPLNGQCVAVMNMSGTDLTIVRQGTPNINGGGANFVVPPATAIKNGALIVSNGSDYFIVSMFGNGNMLNGATIPLNLGFAATNATGQIVNSTANLPWNRLSTGSMTTDWRYVTGTAVIAPTSTGRIVANNLGDASTMQPVPAFATGYLHYNGTVLEWVTPTGGGDGTGFNNISEYNGTVNVTGTGGLIVDHDIRATRFRLPNLTDAVALGTDENGYIIARAGGNGGSTFEHLHENTDTETINVTGAGGLVASGDLVSDTQVIAPRFTVNPNPVTPEELATRLRAARDATDHTSAFRVLSPDSVNWLDINVPDDGFGDPMLTSSTGKIIAPIAVPVSFPVEYLS